LVSSTSPTVEKNAKQGTKLNLLLSKKYQRLTPQTCHATFPEESPHRRLHQTNLSYLSLARHDAHAKCPCLQTPETLATIACWKTLPADRFFSSVPMPQAAIYSCVLNTRCRVPIIPKTEDCTSNEILVAFFRVTSQTNIMRPKEPQDTKSPISKLTFNAPKTPHHRVRYRNSIPSYPNHLPPRILPSSPPCLPNYFRDKHTFSCLARKIQLHHLLTPRNHQ